MKLEDLEFYEGVKDGYVKNIVKSIVEKQETFYRKLIKDYSVDISEVPYRVKIRKYPNDDNDYIYIDSELAGIMSKVDIAFNNDSKNHSHSVSFNFKAINFKETGYES